MNQTPPPPSNETGSQNFDPQTGQPLGHMGQPGQPYGQPVQPGAPYADSYPPGYPQSPYPPQGGQPYQTYGYAPREQGAFSKFFGWIFDFKLKNSAAQPAHTIAYLLSVLTVFAFAIARLVDSIGNALAYFDYSRALEGVWVLISNLVAVPLVTLAVLGIVRLGFDAFTSLAAKKDQAE